jgi:hypothetical protein
VIDCAALYHAQEAGRVRDKAALADLDSTIGWDRDWLARHCKGRGRHRCRMIASTAAVDCAGEALGCAPRVANRHHFHGRPLPDEAIYVGRGTPLGNPYKAADPDALAKYRRWLWGRLQAEDASVLEAIRAIKPTSLLVCSCWPRPCHADIIRAAWGWLRESSREK